MPRQAKVKGATTNVPSGPTGRLVLGQAFEKGNDRGATGSSHWLPDAVKSGIYSWKCPMCGLWFDWYVDEKQWRLRG